MVYMGPVDTELSAGDKKSVVDITAEYVVSKISRGGWELGAKVPTEFELVETLKVSRNSVRGTIRVLIVLGLLEIRRADDTYAVDHFSEKMMTPWACSLLLGDDDSPALLELRIVIKQRIFPSTIQRGTEEDVRTIYGASEHFIVLAQDVQATSSEILDVDIRYRERICGASHNHLTAHLNGMITSANLHSHEESTEEAITCNNHFRMVDSHRKPVEIIVQRHTADLDEALSCCYKYWGIVLQDQK